MAITNGISTVFKNRLNRFPLWHYSNINTSAADVHRRSKRFNAHGNKSFRIL